MQTVILAGGLGTRLAEETSVRPKPMVEIGDRPILQHVMDLYDAHGFTEFVIALGYLGHMIKRHVMDWTTLSGHLAVDLSSGSVTRHSPASRDWKVSLIETGNGTETGGRLKRCAPHLRPETFMLTYGDGLSSVDLGAVLEFHRRHGKLATVTAVHPPARWGEMDLDHDQVISFAEKSQVRQGWINGGFMVFEPGVLERIEGDHTVLERDVLTQLASEGQLRAWRHEGFWQAMDTLRDVRALTTLWESGSPPWVRPS
ncbi:MAG: glucose-1-phosphate cytidylyltransferase [Candidatus Eiseniibacteriota bacterium]